MTLKKHKMNKSNNRHVVMKLIEDTNRFKSTKTRVFVTVATCRNVHKISLSKM